MIKKSLFITGVVFLGLSGCAEQTIYDRYKAGLPAENVLYLAGATEASRNRDVTNCQVYAAQQVPQNQVIRTSSSYTTPVQTTCNHIGTQVFCNTSGGQTYGGGTYSVDANANLRSRVYHQCLADRGYRYVNLPVCPAGVVLKNRGKLPPLSRTTCYMATPDGRSAIGEY